MTGSWSNSYDLNVYHVKLSSSSLGGRSSSTVVASLSCLLALLLMGCTDSAPVDLQASFARDELNAAFGVGRDEPVSLYTDARATGREDVWLVDFKVAALDTFMQARFVRTPDVWALDKVRPRPRAGQVSEWLEVGAVLGQLQARAARTAQLTMQRMTALASWLDRYALLDASRRYPAVAAGELGELLRREGYAAEADWEHDLDGWGRPFVYHPSPEGDVFMLASQGADGAWDEPLQLYLTRTDERNLTGKGPSPDARSDLILATGTWLQRFVPEG